MLLCNFSSVLQLNKIDVVALHRIALRHDHLYRRHDRWKMHMKMKPTNRLRTVDHFIFFSLTHCPRVDCNDRASVNLCTWVFPLDAFVKCRFHYTENRNGVKSFFFGKMPSQQFFQIVKNEKRDFWCCCCCWQYFLCRWAVSTHHIKHYHAKQARCLSKNQRCSSFGLCVCLPPSFDWLFSH